MNIYEIYEERKKEIQADTEQEYQQKIKALADELGI